MTAQLPTWVTLSLREPLDPEKLVSRIRTLGVNADLTRDGITLPGGFLAWLAAEEPGGWLDLSLHEPPLALGSMSLHISGGSNELARTAHAESKEMREMAARMRESLDHLTRTPGGPTPRIESAASRKMGDLTRLITKLSPLATTVVAPHANHIARPAAAFAGEAATYEDGTSYTFPLWSFLKLRPDATGEHLATTGLWLFGLPDAGMPLVEGIPQGVAVEALGGLKREMVAEGWWPEDGAAFHAGGLDLEIERVHGSLWVVPRGHGGDPRARSAHGHFARISTLGSLIGTATHHHIAADESGIAFEHYLRRGGAPHMAFTNGLSTRTQAGGSAEMENDYIELALLSHDLGPWANKWLQWGASSVRMNDGRNPIKPYDRLVLPEVDDGIAGAVVWPSGDLRPARVNEPLVHLWDLLPLLPEELATFRAQPGAQQAWMDEREARQDFIELHQRWRRPGR